MYLFQLYRIGRKCSSRNVVSGEVENQNLVSWEWSLLLPVGHRWTLVSSVAYHCNGDLQRYDGIRC